MKWLITLLVLALPICSFAQISGNLIDNGKYKGLIFSKDVKIDKQDTVTRWTPSEKDIQILEADLKVFLIKQSKTSPKNDNGVFINKNLYKYMRQYVGYISPKGERIIYINCFWYEKDDPFTKNWQNEMIRVFDGGKYFWQIHYNMKTRIFFGFAVNGVA